MASSGRGTIAAGTDVVSTHHRPPAGPSTSGSSSRSRSRRGALVPVDRLISRLVHQRVDPISWPVLRWDDPIDAVEALHQGVGDLVQATDFGDQIPHRTCQLLDAGRSRRASLVRRLVRAG